MNKSLIALLAATAAFVATAPASAADVGVSVSVNQPGLYGRIDIGHVPVAPVLVYPQPTVIVQTPVAVQRQPIYMHVPPGHAKNWAKHCGRYNACGQPVYFVQENWYQEQYAVREHGGGPPHGKGHGNGRGKHGD